MRLKADRIDDYIRHRQELCYTFNIASAAEMKGLGSAFAPVVRKLQKKSGKKQKPASVGFHARGDKGKTTLIKGIMQQFKDKTAVESACGFREQYTWSCGAQGHIRHYDAGISKNMRQKWFLPTYKHNTGKQRYGTPLVDLVEHPKADKNRKKFDCLIGIDALIARYEKTGQTEGNDRTVTVIAPPKLAATKEFQSFLKQAENFRADIHP